MTVTNKKVFRKRHSELCALSNEELISLYEGKHSEVDDAVLQKLFEDRGIVCKGRQGEVFDNGEATEIIDLAELKGVKTVEGKSPGMGWTEGLAFVSGIVVIFLTMRFSILLSICLGCATSIALYFLMRFTRRYWRRLAVKDQYAKDL